MNGFFVVIVLAAVGVLAWVLTTGVWWLVRRIGRFTGLDEKADRFLDVDGGMDSMQYVELRERHRGGGAP
jgi:hypothetical protein